MCEEGMDACICVTTFMCIESIQCRVDHSCKLTKYMCDSDVNFDQ